MTYDSAKRDSDKPGDQTSTGQPVPPLPVPDEGSTEFWLAAARHELAMQRCEACGWYAYPPDITCINCQVDPPAFRWERVSGRGRVKTWTVMRDSFLPGFAAAVPYVVADVELVEQPGLRMIAQLPEVTEHEVEPGMAVEVAFTDVSDACSIPHFVRSGS